MNTASKVMYIVGLVTNIIYIIWISIWTLIAFIGSILGDLLGGGSDGSSTIIGIIIALVGCVLLILFVVQLIVCAINYKAIRKNITKSGPRVCLIIFGIIPFNIFYLLCGIFSKPSIEEPKEEIINSSVYSN